jgi:hypothetical protein
VEFKGSDQDPTTVPVEWICWLNGQRKKAPTPEELAELEARRERVKQNIECMHKMITAYILSYYFLFSPILLIRRCSLLFLLSLH